MGRCTTSSSSSSSICMTNDDYGAEVYDFEAAEHSAIVLEGLHKLLHRGLLCDVTICVEESRFPVHRAILASCSEYFRAMFTDGLKECYDNEVTLNGLSARGMELLIDFTYTSRLTIDLHNVQDVLAAAHHTQMWNIVEACTKFLEGHITLDNCVDVATLADMFTLHNLRDQVYTFMCQNFMQFSLLPDFHRLTFKQLEYLLQINFPVDHPEWEVCQAVLGWVEHDTAERIAYAKKLLKHVIFEEIKVSEMDLLLESDTFKEILAWNLPLKRLIYRRLSRKQLSSSNGPICSLVNRRGYRESVIVVGGFTTESGMTNSVTYYNKETQRWGSLSSIPHVQQCNFGLATMHNNMFVCGGCFNQDMQEVIHPFCFKYNPKGDEWTNIAPMIQERCRFYLAASEGHLYAIGGDPAYMADIISDTSACEKYDIETNVWSSIASLPVCRTQHAGVVYNHLIFISGGFRDNSGEVLDDMYCYDTRRNIWQIKSAMLTPRADHTMFCYNDQIYVAGGWFESSNNNNQRVIVRAVDQYNPQNDQWEAVTHMPKPRLHCSFTAIDKLLYVIGGMVHTDYNNKTRTVDVYDFSTGEWDAGVDFPYEVWEHTSCSLFIPTNALTDLHSDC